MSPTDGMYALPIQVISLDAKNAHAYHNRGISYDKTGQYEKAIQDFQKVLELNSKAFGGGGVVSAQQLDRNRFLKERINKSSRGQAICEEEEEEDEEERGQILP